MKLSFLWKNIRIFHHQNQRLQKREETVLLLCLDWSVLCEDVGFGRRIALLDVFILKYVCFGAEICL